jgi:transposase
MDDKTQKTLFCELISAFLYLDGVPREIKSDNQKACLGCWEVGQPVFNARYLAFATHYLLRPLRIASGKPTENLKVDRPFYSLERSLLNGRESRDRDDLKEQL